jgi:hypothetical protein
MRSRMLRAAALAAGLAVAFPAMAAEVIPVRVRVLKASRQGTAAVDPRLDDLKGQLGQLAYVRWDQVDESQSQMGTGKTWLLKLPDGSALELTLVESRADSVTFLVKVPAQKTQSRLTIAKDKRIVHQVVPEKGGEAYFVSIRPWP